MIRSAEIGFPFKVRFCGGTASTEALPEFAIFKMQFGWILEFGTAITVGATQLHCYLFLLG